MKCGLLLPSKKKASKRKGEAEEEVGGGEEKQAGLPRTYTALKELGVAQKGVISEPAVACQGILKISGFRGSGK